MLYQSAIQPSREYAAFSAPKGCSGHCTTRRVLDLLLGITGEAEANLTMLACSTPPEGRARWTLQLLADQMVVLGYVESISDTKVAGILKKTNSSPGRRSSGASQAKDQTPAL